MAARKQRQKAWSLAGSARSARDARIAAVRYMRDAVIEREWHAAVLAYGHQARAASSGDPDGARALHFAAMGYPPSLPEDWDRASAAMLADEARYLAGADLYVLTPQMLNVVIAAAQSLTSADLGLLRDDDLPGLSGVVILPARSSSGSQAGGLYRHIGFTWRSPWPDAPSGGMGFRGPSCRRCGCRGTAGPCPPRLHAGGPRPAPGPAAHAAGRYLVLAAAPGHAQPGA